MKQALIVSLVFVLLAGTVSASIIAAELSEQKCGNGLRDGYEICEQGTAFDLCPAIGRLLKIAMVCNENTCACLPGERAKNCGNGIREGAEACDPGDNHLGPQLNICDNLSQIIGQPLKCDPATCDCVNSGLKFVPSVCGDNKTEGSEDCEADADCPRGRTCENCSCVYHEDDLNLSIQHNITTDVELPPTIEQITAQSGKHTIVDFVLEDYIGEVIPDELQYFDDETITVHIVLKDNTTQNVSLVTTQTVVQETHAEAAAKPTMNIWLDEGTVRAIKASDTRTKTIVAMLADGTITYKPTGFWRRLWFFFFTPF